MTLSRLRPLLASHLSTTTDSAEGRDYAYSVRELVEPHVLTEAMSRMPASSRSEHDPRITGTLFAKSYSLLALSIATTLTLTDLLPGTAAARIDVDQAHGMRVYLPILPIDEKDRAGTAERLPAPDSSLPSTTGDARALMLRQRLELLLFGHYEPLHNRIAELTRAQPGTMWSLLSSNIRNTFLRIRQQATTLGLDDERLNTLSRDEGVIFSVELGERQNPLDQPTRLYRPQTAGAEPTYLRNRCCLRYRIEVDGAPVPYCLTCPLLADEDRERMIAAHSHAEH